MDGALDLVEEDPVEEDEYPLPLFSNCLPQLLLRALLLVSVQMFVASYFVTWHTNFALVLALATSLGVRNWMLRSHKAEAGSTFSDTGAALVVRDFFQCQRQTLREMIVVQLPLPAAARLLGASLFLRLVSYAAAAAAVQFL